MSMTRGEQRVVDTESIGYGLDARRVEMLPPTDDVPRVEMLPPTDDTDRRASGKIE